MVPNIYPLQFYRFLGAPDGFFDGTGLEPADLERLGGTIEFSQYCRILLNARRCSGDETIALRLGAALGPSLTHGLLQGHGHSWRHQQLTALYRHRCLARRVSHP